MKIRPEELSENGYQLLDRLTHQELIPFVRLYLNKKTFYSRFYLLANVLIFILTLWFIWSAYQRSAFSFGVLITHFSYGLALAFMLLPLHEYIHVVAYKSQGAKHTSYDANWKKFYFMALADQFVASRKEFQIVALAPFVVISCSLLLALPLVAPDWIFTILGTLLAHTAMCSGDFGLLSYFAFHKEKEIVTYDDKASGQSFFYEKKQEWTKEG